MNIQTTDKEVINKFKTPEYKAWLRMKQRCYNHNHHKFNIYGARGIKVSDEWLSSFSQFLKDLGNRPSDRHSLDRIDNDKGYSKENCRWATATEQARNKRNNIKYTLGNTTLVLSEWVSNFNQPYHTVYSRLKSGKPIYSALKKPVRAYTKQK